MNDYIKKYVMNYKFFLHNQDYVVKWCNHIDYVILISGDYVKNTCNEWLHKKIMWWTTNFSYVIMITLKIYVVKHITLKKNLADYVRNSTT